MRSLFWLSLVLPSVALADEPPAPAPDSTTPTVTVHVDAPLEVDLVRTLSVDGRSSAAPSRVCAAPCDVPVEARSDALFFVEGPDIPRSGPFTLEAGDRTDIVVDAGSLTQRYVGITVLTLGAISSVVGGTVLALDALDEETESSRVVGGGVALGLGLATLAVGVMVAATSGTDVDVRRIAAYDPLRFEF